MYTKVHVILLQVPLNLEKYIAEALNTSLLQSSVLRTHAYNMVDPTFDTYRQENADYSVTINFVGR